jgi:hypothetical protein
MRLLFALVIVTSSAAFSQDYVDEADLKILRLPPSEFPQLPRAIRQELAHRGCTIPQIPGEKNPHNVIKGRFVRRREIDWAVLCSIHRTSSILVFRNAAAKEVLELAVEPDAGRLQTDETAQLVYSREIFPACGQTIIQYQSRSGEKSSALPIRHLGIADSFVGKASTIWYFYRGKWLIVDGAD